MKIKFSQLEELADRVDSSDLRSATIIFDDKQVPKLRIFKDQDGIVWIQTEPDIPEIIIKI